MSQTMTDTQRALWQAWHDSEKALGKMIGTEPKAPSASGNSDVDKEAWQNFRDAAFDWREEWNHALGFRDAMHKACEIAKVPNFGNHG